MWKRGLNMFRPDITFANPDFLYFLFLVPLVVLWFILRGRVITKELRYSSLSPFRKISKTWREQLRFFPFILRMIALVVLIVALARPQQISRGEEITTEGIDIVLLVDISGSMLAEDFKPNRIEAAKKVASSFIDGRMSDRIGLVIFAGESFTQCPLTLDYRVLKNLMTEVKSGVIEDGTAIGMALANGVNRLKDSLAESKVMILLTDGVNNRGEIDPVTATQIAQTFGIRIHTIGVGTRGTAPYPVKTPFGTRYQNVQVEVDEETLRKVADMTGGMYFRATDNRKLEAIYSEIDQMEKTEMEVRRYRKYDEQFSAWVGFGLLFLVLELGLSNTIFRKIP
jgi:Ca-activated chloride channel family protein